MTDTLRQSRSPLYLQITEILRQSLSRGIWKPGELLPTISVLAAKYSVAKITVRQAVKILEAEGLLESRRGRGTMALAPPQPRTRLCLGTRLSTLVDMYRGDKPELNLLEDSEWYSFNGYKGITQKWLSNKLKGYGVETEKTRDANVYVTNELEELFKASRSFLKAIFSFIKASNNKVISS